MVVAAVENYMQIHIADGHKDVQNKGFAAHKAGAAHKVAVADIDRTDHTHLGVGHHCTLDPVVWGYPIDLLVLKDFQIGRIGDKVGEHHTLEEQEGEVLALDHSNQDLGCQNLLVEVDPMFVFEVAVVVVGAPAVLARIQRCKKAVDP